MTDLSSHIQIRPMTVEDVPAVAALEAEIFSDAWSKKLYRETLDSGRYDCQVLEIAFDMARGTDAIEGAEDAGARWSLAGYFCGQVIFDEAEVHRIAVRPALRGMGYGQILLEDFLRRVQKQGAVAVLLEVRAGNAPAIGLYEKNGFGGIGVRKGYYQHPREDALILQKRF